MKAIQLLIALILSACSSFGQSKITTRIIAVKHEMDSLDALCDAISKVIAHPGTRKGEVNYFSSKHPGTSHNVTLVYESSSTHKIHEYSYGGGKRLLATVIDEDIVLVNWKKVDAEEASMVRLNDSILVWTYRKDVFSEWVESTESVRKGK